MFFLDSRKEHRSTAADHVLPGEGEEEMLRRLADGREFSIIKNFWKADDLEVRFARSGVSLEVASTQTYFQYGVGARNQQ
jgi:demethylmenaquinone methyltransferase/2-methoxy-6-polyprenyl-1,4-benzoquinol methylase